MYKKSNINDKSRKKIERPFAKKVQKKERKAILGTEFRLFLSVLITRDKGCDENTS